MGGEERGLWRILRQSPLSHSREPGQGRPFSWTGLSFNKWKYLETHEISQGVLRNPPGLQAIMRPLHVQVKLNSLLLLLNSRSIVGSSQDWGSYSKLVGEHKALLNVGSTSFNLPYSGLLRWQNSIDAGGCDYLSLGIWCLEIIQHFENSSLSSLSFLRKLLNGNLIETYSHMILKNIVLFLCYLYFQRSSSWSIPLFY